MNPPRAVVVNHFERRGQAAQELWNKGYPVESNLLLCNGLNDLLTELGASRALPNELEREVELLLEEFRALERERAGGDFTRDHAAWAERARGVASRILRALRPSRRGLGRRRLVQIACGALLFLAAIGVWVLLSRRPRAKASAEYSVDFHAAHAVDGLRETEWLLPDKTLGSLDVILRRTRSVHAVVLWNAHNRHYLDRATKRARVTLFDGGNRIDSRDVEFAKIEAKPVRARATFAGQKATRVQVEILEAFGTSGGLSEVEIE